MKKIEIEDMESLDNAIDEELYTSMSPLMRKQKLRLSQHCKRSEARTDFGYCHGG